MAAFLLWGKHAGFSSISSLSSFSEGSRTWDNIIWIQEVTSIVSSQHLLLEIPVYKDGLYLCYLYTHTHTSQGGTVETVGSVGMLQYLWPWVQSSETMEKARCWGACLCSNWGTVLGRQKQGESRDSPASQPCLISEFLMSGYIFKSMLK